MSDYFDQLFSDFDERRAMADLARAEDAVAKANAVAQSRRQLLRAYEAWKDAQTSAESNPAEIAVQAQASSAATAIVTTPPTSDATPPTGRDAVRGVFLAGPQDIEWTIPGIADVLGLGPDYHTRIGTTLQRLVSDGAVIRPRKGRYKLPPATVTAGAREEREAGSENGSRNGSGQAVRSSDLFGLAGPAPS